jgi:tetratricopeptide (TPR) repeat protein
MLGPAGVACVLALAAPAKAAGPRPEYLALLQAYSRGARAEAIAGLGAYDQRELERQLGELQRLVAAAERCRCQEPIQGISLRAAVMLHADRDYAERPVPAEPELPRHCPGWQARLAGRFAALAARAPDTRDFARRFYLAMAKRCQWDYCLEEARAWAREGLALFPRDADLLLAAGAAYEEGGTLGMTDSRTLITGLPRGQHDNIRVSARQRQGWLAEARRYLDGAVAAAPDDAMARLRQGRVLFRLGEREPARGALGEALQRAREPGLRFLAHMFLGGTREDAGEVEAAAAEYRLALEIDPLSQSAAVALAHALQLAGEAEEAREVLRSGVSAAGRRAGRDAYWDYLVGNALDVEEAFARLREETLE